MRAYTQSGAGSRGLYLAWVMALIATLGSLYFSEVRGFVPCPLCWFQRICMYPLALLLGIAAYRSDAGIRLYAVPLAVVGWAVALYHVLENFGVVQSLKLCSVGGGVSCNTRWPIFGGEGALSRLNDFISIPILSLAAFTLVLVFLLLPTRPRRY